MTPFVLPERASFRHRPGPGSVRVALAEGLADLRVRARSEEAGQAP